MLSKKLPAVVAALAASVAVAAPAQAHIGLQASPPLGSTKASFLDASMVYGSTGYQLEPTSIDFPN